MSVGLPEQSGEEKGLRTERPAAHKTGPKDRGLSVSIRALYIDLAQEGAGAHRVGHAPDMFKIQKGYERHSSGHLNVNNNSEAAASLNGANGLAISAA
ncbi:hypothetical protein A1Q2_05444 [Trichosporon asahii var. asahii CBS 8904]|uniref:Uncharacterized protein n=1 Tax=Trichosporon asahii var. asahii (strain CBS 8904) TaxID=1220162 RepID=K1VLQ8_TRIAC|nr:hypothetical protein A1Q2_05444 [Trichosporon asahii var. asahii CBS 8904]